MIITVIMSVILSVFSTAIMSYISMATPIGPWIAPTLVLIGLLVMSCIRHRNQTRSLALMTASGSVGGILATAFGFSFPTLYFLNPTLFNEWMATPIYFAAAVAGLGFVAGAFGLLAANLLETRFIDQEQLAFPIGQLVYKMIAASNNLRKAYELMVGFIGTAIFCILQSGMFIGRAFLPKSITLIQACSLSIISIPTFSFDIWPMLWAIGFVTGHVIAIPLAVGAFSKIILVDPINSVWFAGLSSVEFVLAFCSGMVLYGVLMSFTAVPALVRSGWALARDAFRGRSSLHGMQFGIWLPMLGSVLSASFFFIYFGFSVSTIVFVLLGTFACIYQIAFIAGKMGIAPLGRFATFIMIPALVLFTSDFVHLVFIATFVEAACGVAADILFGRKMARLAAIDHRTIARAQWLGLVVSCATLGVVFWLLINHFGLGSPELCAYKAQSRQLLIDAKQFNYHVLLLGALFSAVLSWAKINPTLVLGGLLMPLNISIGLIFGGLLTKLVKDRERWEPFWSGVFASNSIIMLLKAVIW